MNRDTENTKHGLTRRRVLQMGTGLAVVGALGALASKVPVRAQEPPKSATPEWFIDFGLNKETRPEYLRGLLTPASMFFIRSHDATPAIDLKTYRLKVEGSSVLKPIELSYDDLLRLPFRSVLTWIECAGNGRSFFGQYYPKPAAGTQWHLGAIGAAEWTGVPLSVVLDLAGLKPDAVDVLLEGLDELKVNRPIPIEKAMDSNTILAYAMNGEALPPDHGFPIRAITPGLVGINYTKWLGRIQVENKKIVVQTNTKTYVLAGPDYPDTPAVTTQNIKSLVALPREGEGTISAGKQVIRGYAWSPHGKIVNLRYSLDSERWREATLEESKDPLLWQRWYFTWDAKPGRHYVLTKATDEKGNTQPTGLVPFNEQGYLFNSIAYHIFYVE